MTAGRGAGTVFHAMAILSVQSWVAAGHVGNSAALFPLQRLGFETWAVPTWVGSNHPGHPRWHGGAMPADRVAGMLAALVDRGLLARCRAVLTGYVGDPAIGEAIERAVAAARPAGALYSCDPVIGDRAEGIYVAAGIPALFRERLVPAADIVTPNQFELEWLVGRALPTMADIAAGAGELRRSGRGGTVLVTSVEAGGDPARQRMLAVGPDGAWLVEHPTVPVRVKGTGDLVAALFLAGLLRTGALPAALAYAASAIHGVLESTRRAGGDELALVAAQDEIVAPARWFAAEPVRP
ncbi:pyridoxal kinase PdxY [Stella sp.]|uniref:pyridoxal kinase PdxY n=1 Tax=Stella sp. TaxID=2912054 RepID=UPI0035AE4FB1